MIDLFVKKLYDIISIYKRVVMETLAAILIFLGKVFLLISDTVTIYGLFLKAMFISIAGGLTDYILSIRKSKEKFDFKKSILHMFVAGFSGFLTYQLCHYFNIEEQMMGFIVGISGFAGQRAIVFLEDLTKSVVEKMATIRFVETKKNEDDKKPD